MLHKFKLHNSTVVAAVACGAAHCVNAHSIPVLSCALLNKYRILALFSF